MGRRPPRGGTAILPTFVAAASLIVATQITASADPSRDLDAACERIDNSYRCAETIEALQLPSNTDRVHRDGKTLFVRLNTGSWLAFPAGDRYGPLFLFRECNERARKCILFKQWDEDAQHVIVDLGTGRCDTYSGQVTFSPDATRFTVGGSWGHWGSSSLEIRDTATDVVEFALDRTDLEALAEQDLQCTRSDPIPGVSLAAASEVRWLQDDMVEFRLMCRGIEADPGGWIKRTYELVLAESGWRVGAATVSRGTDGPRASSHGLVPRK